MSSRRDLVARAVALAALVACKDTTATPAIAHDAAPAGPRVVQLAPPGPIVMAAPTIELPKLESFQLLDAGTGPKAALRYQLAAGASSFLAQTTLSSRHLEHGAFTPPVTLPAIHDGFAITVAAEHPGQLALRALPGEAATASPDAEAYLASWRKLLQNRRMTITVDDRGQVGTLGFNDDPTGTRSAQARADLVQRLLSTIVPLPVEPVGTGARWRVVTILKQGPAFAKQTATYTLVAPGAVWKVHVKLQRVAEAQQLDDPALPAGTTADLIAMFRAFEGDVEVDPKQAMITRGTLTIESRLHVKLSAAGQPAAQEQLFEDTGSVVLSHQR
jgi:hypothetical protein